MSRWWFVGQALCAVGTKPLSVSLFWPSLPLRQVAGGRVSALCSQPYASGTGNEFC